MQKNLIALMEDTIDLVMQGYEFGQDGKEKVINKKFAAESEKIFHDWFVRQGSHLYEKARMNEDDTIVDFQREIDFQELSAHPSKFDTETEIGQHRPEEEDDMMGDPAMAADPLGGGMGAPAMGGGMGLPESMGDPEEIDFTTIFNLSEDFGEDDGESEGDSEGSSEDDGEGDSEGEGAEDGDAPFGGDEGGDELPNDEEVGDDDGMVSLSPDGMGDDEMSMGGDEMGMDMGMGDMPPMGNADVPTDPLSLDFNIDEFLNGNDGMAMDGVDGGDSMGDMDMADADDGMDSLDGDSDFGGDSGEGDSDDSDSSEEGTDEGEDRTDESSNLMPKKNRVKNAQPMLKKGKGKK